MQPPLLEDKPEYPLTCEPTSEPLTSELLNRPRSRMVLLGLAIFFAALILWNPHVNPHLKACWNILSVVLMYLSSPLLPLCETIQRHHMLGKLANRIVIEPVDDNVCVTADLDEFQRTVRECIHRAPCLPAMSILLFASMLHTAMLRTAIGAGSWSALHYYVLLALATAGLPPLLSGWFYWLVKTKTAPRSKRSAPARNLLQRCGNSFLNSLQHAVSKPLPFYATYFGCMLGVLLFTYMPGGLGDSITGFLYACMSDANIVIDAKIAAAQDPLLAGVIHFLLAAGFGALVHPLAVLLGSSYQAVLNNFISNNAGDGVIDAIHEAAINKRTTVFIREKHPHIRSAFQSALMFAACYGTIFWMIAFWQSGVNDSIRQWLQACIADAYLFAGKPPLPLHSNMLIFLASMIAGWATIPIAMMTCVWIPPHKRNSFQVTTQGILRADLVFRPALHFWSSLRRVRLKNAYGKNPVLQLCFTSGQLKIGVNEIDAAQLAALLAMADEYSIKCEFDAASQALRLRLSQEQSEASLAEKKKFESTIFKPHNVADVLNNGAYRIVRKLATKPWAATYLGRKQNGELVIIKQFVTPAGAKDAQTRRSEFEREHALLQQLDHPSLVKVQCTFAEKDADYLIIDYIAGQNLRHIITTRGARGEKVVLQWALEIAQQLAYLHAQTPSILHRDLTPDNLMLDDEGHVRIVDFGAAHQFLEGVTGTLIGKQAYIAPEQLRGKASQRSDIYSFGGTLYYLLTGNDPKALNQSDVGNELVTSDGLRQLIWDCTDFDEENRPANMCCVIERLQSIQSSLRGSKIKLKTTAPDLVPELVLAGEQPS